MIPRQILEIADRYPEDQYSFSITKIEQTGETVVLEFLLIVHEFQTLPSIQQLWTVEIMGYITGNVQLSNVNRMQLKTEHPLLWEYTDTQCELFFSGECESLEKLFYSLYNSHESIFRGLVPFNTFINYPVFRDLFMYTNGQMAKGPKKLLQEYGICLQLHGMKYSLVGGYQPDPPHPVLLLMGDSYIIAEVFTFRLG
jgi:hypothetical protein